MQRREFISWGIAALACADTRGSATGSSLWTRFRGPAGSGVWDGSGGPGRPLPDSLAKSAAAWSADLPQGASSPIAGSGRVFVTAYENADRFLICLSLRDGRELWRKSVRQSNTSFFHAMHGPATPTPVVEGDRVFVYFPDYGLASFDVQGKEMWRRPFGPFHSVQGIAASPVTAGGLVILVVDTPEEAFVATFRQRDGQPVWRTNRPAGILGGYATPVVRGSEVIVAGAGELSSYQVATGERVWWGPGITNYTMASPFLAGDSVYTTEPVGVGWPPFTDPLQRFDKNQDGRVSINDEAAGDASWEGSLRGIDRNAGNNDGFVTAEEYAKGTSVQDGGLFRVRLGGRGDISGTHVVWRQTRSIPAHSGALLYGGRLYTVRRGILASYDPESGRLQNEGRMQGAPGDYYASPVAGDNRIYMASFEGVASVVDVSGSAWRVLSTSDLGEPILATPAIVDGTLLLRTARHLYCFAGWQSKRSG